MLPATGDLRGLAVHYGEEVRGNERFAVKLGNRHRFVYFAVAVGAVVAGVVAGVAGLAEREPLLTGIAGFTASALAAITPTLDAKRLAAFHFEQGAQYGAIASLFETLAVRPEAPTPNQIEGLIERLATCKSRRVEAD